MKWKYQSKTFSGEEWDLPVDAQIIDVKSMHRYYRKDGSFLEAEDKVPRDINNNPIIRTEKEYTVFFIEPYFERSMEVK
jgi:hypothetical protein